MKRLLPDLRFAVRSLNRDRRFTLLAVLVLALGIGSVTVIFSAVYGVLIDTFPYAHYDRMVSFSIDEPGQRGLGRELLPIPALLDFRDQNQVFEDMAGGTGGPLHYIHGDQTTQWSVTRETANGYQFLGVKPVLGRLITPEDTKPGAKFLWFPKGAVSVTLDPPQGDGSTGHPRDEHVVTVRGHYGPTISSPFI